MVRPVNPTSEAIATAVVEDRRLRLLALGHPQIIARSCFSVNRSGVSLVEERQPSGIPLTTTTLCGRTPNDRQDPVIHISHAPATTTVLEESPVEAAGQMSHREVLEALSGLLLAMFVAMLSSTVVTNALPRIVTDLDGSQTGYTWVVVATLLAMTATTPIWGKLADLFSKKLLVQTALVIYTVGSLVAAFAPNMQVLIGARVVQGLGVGGLTALVQVVIASMVSPRERGRYSGYIGAVFALATVGGPLIGGVIVDSPLGWRGTFFVGLPFAVAAFVVLQATLHLPVVTRPVQIDYLGATLIVAGVSILLVWVSLAGQQFAWVSAPARAGRRRPRGHRRRAVRRGAGRRGADHPAAPLPGPHHVAGHGGLRAHRRRDVRRDRLPQQYFQIARGMSPTEAGLMSVAMVGGLLVSSIVTGRIISATGLWKRYLVGGMVLVVVGLALLGTIDAATPLVVVGVFMAVLGLGLGATMQNLVLAVQNNTAQADMGAASSVVAFFRSMGGSIGVSALGAVLSHQVTQKVTDGLAALGDRGRPQHRRDPRPGHAAGAGPRGLRARLRRGHRPPVPGRGAVRPARVRLRAVHPRGAAAHDVGPRGGRDRQQWPRAGRGQVEAGVR